MKKNYNTAFNLLLIRDRKVLLLFRSKTGLMDNFWCPVTGGIEPNETPLEMLKREAFEEVDVKVDSIKFSNIVDHVSQSYFLPSEKYFCLDMFFVARTWIGQPSNKEPLKHSRMEWFELDQLPSNTIPSVAQGIRNIITNENYTVCNFFGG